jgi:hypothetical protein
MLQYRTVYQGCIHANQVGFIRFQLTHYDAAHTVPWNPQGPSIKLHDSSKANEDEGRFLGGFVKLRKAALNIFLSARMAQLGFH